MAEPHASEFRTLVRLGAGARDIHGISKDIGFARRTLASDAFLAREMGRVDLHQRGVSTLLAAFVGRSPKILDVGCSTGATTVAMALSPILGPDLVIGVDPDPLSLRAAEVRANGYGLDPERVAFVRNCPGDSLPFASEEFDVVSCVSVLEFVPTMAGRRQLVQEMKRVVRPGGHIFIATPNPLRLRDLHARRWLGDFIRRSGFPWATPPWAMRAMLADCTRMKIEPWVVARALERVGGVPVRTVPRLVAEMITWASAWQRLLVRKP